MKIRPFDLDPDDDSLYVDQRQGKFPRRPSARRQASPVPRKPHSRPRRLEDPEMPPSV